MPKMSGRDLAERLIRVRPDIKVLYMSGYGGQTLAAHGTDAAVALIRKPFTAAELVRRVREVLEAPVRPRSDESSAASLGLPKIVVRFANGTLLKGYTRDFQPTKARFHVFREAGQEDQGVAVELRELKAVFFVRDFMGNPRYEERKAFAEGTKPSGRKIEVKFLDGETMVGYTLGYEPHRPGFFLFPADPQSNNLRAFLVSGAVAQVRYI
jgi:hypothetical protein